MKPSTRSLPPLAGRALLAGAVLAGCLAASLVDAQLQRAPRWWKGNLHTHSLWSDGDDFPEMIADWYKGKGYHFLALSDHNILSEGEKWVNVERLRPQALEKYRARFGADWVEERDGAEKDQGKRQVRLKPLAELKPLLEEPDRFLMIPSEELTDRFEKLPIHMNVTNIRDLIPPQGGSSVLEVMQRNVDAVAAQRAKTKQPMFVHMNHPNFGWAITAEDLARVRGERFFEVYNGHPTVYNNGDNLHAGTERMWDIILTQRLAELGLEPMLGVAVDDAHNYHGRDPKLSNAGRGWVMVRAARLTPESIVHAMERGDFYATTGVRLKDVRRETDRLSVEVEAETGVEYTVQFIGTRKGYDAKSEPVTGTDGQPLPVTRRYSADVGAVLAEMKGPIASYTLKGDELYVRAKILSNKPQENPSQEGGMQTAWTQPLVPRR